MPIAIDSTVVLLATAAGFAFLFACAWHNRRIGYRKVRSTETPVDQAIRWLASVRDMPSVSELPIPAARAVSETEQLLSLNAALLQHQMPALQDQPKPVVAAPHAEELVGQTKV